MFNIRLPISSELLANLYNITAFKIVLVIGHLSSAINVHQKIQNDERIKVIIHLNSFQFQKEISATSCRLRNGTQRDQTFLVSNVENRPRAWLKNIRYFWPAFSLANSLSLINVSWWSGTSNSFSNWSAIRLRNLPIVWKRKIKFILHIKIICQVGQ